MHGTSSVGEVKGSYRQASHGHGAREQVFVPVCTLVEVSCQDDKSSKRMLLRVPRPCLRCYLQDCLFGFLSFDGLASVVELMPNVAGDEDKVSSVIFALG